MQNPNPLTYCKSILEFGKMDAVFRAKKKYAIHKTKDLKSKPKVCPSSIPNKETAPEMITGLGTDTAGPGKYNPSLDQVKNRQQKINFGISKVKRDVFKSDDTPGPAEYQMASSKKDKYLLESYVFKMKESTARQPLAKPSKLTSRENSKILGTAESQQKSNTNLDSVSKPFMSSTTRGVSFIPAQHASVPGPAFYFKKEPVENFKQRLLKQQKHEVPFGSNNILGWQQIPPQSKIPGPGAYIDISDPINSSVTKVLYQLKQKNEWQGVIRNPTPAFGTIISNSLPKNTLDTPGPGAYFSESSNALIKGTLIRKNCATFGFQSSSTRDNQQYASDNLNIRLVGSRSDNNISF